MNNLRSSSYCCNEPQTQVPALCDFLHLQPATLVKSDADAHLESDAATSATNAVHSASSANIEHASTRFKLFNKASEMGVGLQHPRAYGAPEDKGNPAKGAKVDLAAAPHNTAFLDN